jgi:hypothetical protein
MDELCSVLGLCLAVAILVAIVLLTVKPFVEML